MSEAPNLQELANTGIDPAPEGDFFGKEPEAQPVAEETPAELAAKNQTEAERFKQRSERWMDTKVAQVKFYRKIAAASAHRVLSRLSGLKIK